MMRRGSVKYFSDKENPWSYSMDFFAAYLFVKSVQSLLTEKPGNILH